MFIKKPSIAELDPIYELPTISLQDKEKVLFGKIINNHINEQGCLLFDRYLPISNNALYLKSHDVADFPAWHGQWMATLAMKLAIEPTEKIESLLKDSIFGLYGCFIATGTNGLLARSYIKHDSDKPLSWMKLEDQRPTMFWQKGKDGFWFRGGVAKDHYCGAILGLSTIISLHNSGHISLDSKTKLVAHQTLLEIAHFLIKNKYKIIDVDGKKTEFGGLNWWFLNGFNALQLLAMLKTGKAIGDKLCTKEYKRLVRFGASISTGFVLWLLGTFYAIKGRENAWGHYSDDQAIYTNALVFYLNSDTKDDRVLKHIRLALKGMWKFLRYSQKSYVTFIHQIVVGTSLKRLNQALGTLVLFPDDKRIIAPLKRKDTHQVQPVCNQYISSHYWKSNYFKKAELAENSHRINVQRSGQDYLFTYWLGRYFKLIKEEL